VHPCLSVCCALVRYLYVSGNVVNHPILSWVHVRLGAVRGYRETSGDGQWVGHATGTNRIQLVMFGMQNRILLSLFCNQQ
jgi:hypothetical protein